MGRIADGLEPTGAFSIHYGLKGSKIGALAGALPRSGRGGGRLLARNDHVNGLAVLGLQLDQLF
jgi:hypothetical protein